VRPVIASPRRINPSSQPGLCVQHSERTTKRYAEDRLYGKNGVNRLTICIISPHFRRFSFCLSFVEFSVELYVNVIYMPSRRGQDICPRQGNEQKPENLTR
jgi:hypothetical protein